MNINWNGKKVEAAVTAVQALALAFAWVIGWTAFGIWVDGKLGSEYWGVMIGFMFGVVSVVVAAGCYQETKEP